MSAIIVSRWTKAGVSINPDFCHSSELLAIILPLFLAIEIQLSFLVIQENTLLLCCLYHYPFYLCKTFAAYSFSFNCTSMIMLKYHFSPIGIIFQLYLLNSGFCMCEYNTNNFLCHLPIFCVHLPFYQKK